MATAADADEILETQRSLRHRLLKSGAAVGWRPARDLAAHMLLELDDASACWGLAVEWIRNATSSDRADGGYATPSQTIYRPGFAEALSSDFIVPSLRDVRVNNWDNGVRLLWHSSRPIVFADMAQEARFGPGLRRDLVAADTVSKIACSLWDGRLPVGLICVDWTYSGANPARAKYARVFDRFESTCRDVIAPILAAAHRFNGAEAMPASEPSQVHALTRAEREVARLAARGLRYKQIAAELNRSFSTVDHQLRSIREKFGVSNNPALIARLARGDFSL